MGILWFAAALPIIVVLGLMVGLRWPAVKAMPIALGITVALSLMVWQLAPAAVFFSFLKGGLIAINILLIVFGAVLLLRVLEHGGAVATIDKLLGNVSKDRRVQAIIVAWLFGSFIEGAAGFGAPQAIVAPLLVSLGFPPLAAVIIAVLANSSAVTFGAVGVPVTFGIGSVAPEHVVAVTHIASILHGILALLVPVFIVWVLTRSFGKDRRSSIRDVLPFALFAGAAFSIPMIITAWLVGPEIASIVGGAVGLAVCVAIARRGWLMPKRTWSFPPQSQWFANWRGHHEPHKHKNHCPVWKALLPYALVALILIITRMDWLPLKAWLQAQALVIPLGTDSYAFQYLYNPGVLFLLVSAFAILLFKLDWADLFVEARDAAARFVHPLIALIAAVGTVQLFQATASNPAGLASIPVTLAQPALPLGSAFLFVSPLIGVLGAFIAGSNTVSNLLFGGFQLSAATAIGLAPALVLSLQTVGGAVGNVIAVHNIVGASATAGIHNREGDVIRATIIPCIIYALAAGILGFVALKIGLV